MSHADPEYLRELAEASIESLQADSDQRLLAVSVLSLLGEVVRYREALDVVREFFVYADKAGEEWSPTVQDEKFEAMRDALAAVGGDPE